MIFVTVGSGKFDRLIKIIDKNVGKIKDKIITQIGDGKYVPKNCGYFRYKPSLEQEYKKASIVIAHGGAGTTFELLKAGKKMISVANMHDRTDKHQHELLKALSKDNYLIWHKNPENIINDIEKARKFKFKKYNPEKCSIPEIIDKFISQLK